MCAMNSTDATAILGRLSSDNASDAHQQGQSVINPFVMDVLRTLQKQPDCTKIYELLEALPEEKLSSLIEGVDYNLALFRKNFLLMNALYTLQEELYETGWYVEIGQVDVKLTPIEEAQKGQALALNAGEARLRDYYNNWKQFVSKESAEVLELLNSFWARYSLDGAYEESLVVLGFDPRSEPDFARIRSRYRQLAQRHHPDRGGDCGQFIRIREAYEVAKSKHL